MKLPNAKSAVIDLNKLRNYSLNLQHGRGKHKARLFAAILGLTSNDAEILQALILEAIQIYDGVLTTADEHGQRYAIDFPITRNQNTATVRTVWITRSTENFPRLVSCYILR
jgi:hypothetical protein